MKLSYNKELSNTVSVPSTAIRRSYAANCLGKPVDRNLYISIAVLNTEQYSTGRPCNLLRPGVILVCLLVLHTLFSIS